MLAQGIHTGVHDQGSLHTDLNFFDFKQTALRKTGDDRDDRDDDDEDDDDDAWIFRFLRVFFFFGRNRRATCRSNRN